MKKPMLWGGVTGVVAPGSKLGWGVAPPFLLPIPRLAPQLILAGARRGEVAFSRDKLDRV